MGTWVSIAALLSMLLCACAEAAIGETALQSVRTRLQGTSRWNTSAVEPCSWAGVTCSGPGSGGAVVRLVLPRLGLAGDLSAILDLRDLVFLDLSGNAFAGPIPAGMSLLRSLQYLDLSSNHLTGSVPPELGKLGALVSLNLSNNALGGPIPVALTGLTRLAALNLNANRFSGTIPADLRRLSALKELQLSTNSLAGQIPEALAELPSLETFTAYENRLTGRIPASLGSRSELTVVNLHSNLLSGEIPASLFASGQLQALVLSQNLLDGSVPPAVGRCPRLSSLRLGGNRFSGGIPPEIGNVTSLTYFEADGNFISGGLVPDFGRCSNLSLLNVASNGITGAVPAELGNLQNLQELILSNNSMSGEIPPALSRCRNLSKLDLSLNRLNGTVPADLCEGAARLQYIILNGNSLRSEIPPEIGACRRLLELQLGSNYLRGRIPAQIGSLSNLQISLNLSFNHLDGSIPTSLGKLDKLVALDLSNNRLSGPVPPELRGMESLIDVDFSNNLLSGVIPTFRPFQNSPAASFLGNRLCGAPLPGSCNSPAVGSPGSGSSSGSGSGTERHRTPLGKVLAVVLGSGLTVFGMVTIVVVLYMVKERRQTATADPESIDPAPTIVTGNVFVDSLKQAISFEAAVEATVKDTTKLGSGTFSSVYRAVMPSGLVLEVRKLKSVDRALSLHQNKMIRELEKLAKICHENIRKPVGFIIFDETVLLLHHHMPNGSLAQLLHGAPAAEGSSFEPDWPRRLSIVLGIAEGLAFLHHCHSPIIHLDIAAANVFLDAGFNPLIGEVEISKLLDPAKGTTSITAVAGSFGYIPPEYAYTMQVTAAGNVYSFGVILLEILTSRLPVEEDFGEGMDLVKWVHSASARKETPEQILDARLSTVSFAWRQQMLAVLKVALLCTDNTPAKRPKMKKVVEMLQQVKEAS